MSLPYFSQSPPDLDELLKNLWNKIRGRRLSSTPSPDISSSVWWILIFFLLFLVTLVFSSVISVKPGEVLVVTRFGAFSHLEQPGLRWTLPLIDHRDIINLSEVKSISTSQSFFTRDGSILNASLALTYTVTDPQKFIYQTHLNSLLTQKLNAMALSIFLNTDLATLLSHDALSSLNLSFQQSLPDLQPLGIELKGINVLSIQTPSALSDSFTKSILSAQNSIDQNWAAARKFEKNLKLILQEQASKALAQAQADEVHILMQAAQNSAEFQSYLPVYHDYPALTLLSLPLWLREGHESFDHTVQEGSNLNSSLSSTESAYLRWRSTHQGSPTDDQNN